MSYCDHALIYMNSKMKCQSRGKATYCEKQKNTKVTLQRILSSDEITIPKETH